MTSAEALADRLRARDATLWPEGSEAPTRLGWLDIHERLLPQCDEVMAWAAGIDAERVVLLGMGGSSLGPEVLRSAIGSTRLIVCDTTDPATVAGIPSEGSFFLVSSKSGTTLEPKALTAHFSSLVPDRSRWAAVTDPGTVLADEARSDGWARVFENDPDIGGRYSVLSWFGLVPAALMGIDIAALCRRACETDVEAAVSFGIRMAEAHQAGRDKLTIRVPEGPFRAFGLWVEQLVAESLGKEGTGIVPVPTVDDEPGPDREHVEVVLAHVLDLGPELVRWEIATAIAGSLLGIDAFDQPDVELAKVKTREALEHLPLPADLPPGVDTIDPAALVPWLQAHTVAGDYVTLQAYVPFGQDEELERARTGIRDALGGTAVTAGYGPRFLHSTGQLHKGGPPGCVAVQLVPPAPTADLPVPGFGYDFGTLIAGQALGDLEALHAKGRRVVRVHVDGGRIGGIA
jgi:transaldolase/glucose-6-phosphate isomerase